MFKLLTEEAADLFGRIAVVVVKGARAFEVTFATVKIKEQVSHFMWQMSTSS